MSKFINTDAVRNDFADEVYSILSDDKTNDRANEIIDIFDSLPSVDLKIVQRGKWLKGEKFHPIGKSKNILYTRYPCSICQHIVMDKTLYCPHCGVRMYAYV